MGVVMAQPSDRIMIQIINGVVSRKDSELRDIKTDRARLVRSALAISLSVATKRPVVTT